MSENNIGNVDWHWLDHGRKSALLCLNCNIGLSDVCRPRLHIFKAAVNIHMRFLIGYQRQYRLS